MKLSLALIIFLLILPSSICVAGELSKSDAIEIAEKFILENGYTDAPSNQIKEDLDYESIEWANDQNELLNQRFNQLKSSAIGIKKGRKGGEPGWSVAFDIVDAKSNNNCRVVTMNLDGTDIRVEHVDGKRPAFIGFDIE